MRITPRQKTFLRTLAYLVQEHGGPVHYSEVARALGVNRFSAYDMLKVLEEKGLVEFDYLLGPERGGPGRSQVVFRPTEKGLGLASSVAAETVVMDEFVELTTRLLERLETVSDSAGSDLLQEILGRLPERRTPLLYCAEMTTALLINLNRVRARVTGLNPLEVLRNIVNSGEAGLGALAGLSLGSTLTQDDRTLAEKLHTFVCRYQEHIHELSEESKLRLQEFLQEAIQTLNNRKSGANLHTETDR